MCLILSVPSGGAKSGGGGAALLDCVSILEWVCSCNRNSDTLTFCLQIPWTIAAIATTNSFHRCGANKSLPKWKEKVERQVKRKGKEGQERWGGEEEQVHDHNFCKCERRIKNKQSSQFPALYFNFILHWLYMGCYLFSFLRFHPVILFGFSYIRMSLTSALPNGRDIWENGWKFGYFTWHLYHYIYLIKLWVQNMVHSPRNFLTPIYKLVLFGTYYVYPALKFFTILPSNTLSFRSLPLCVPKFFILLFHINGS